MDVLSTSSSAIFYPPPAENTMRTTSPPSSSSAHLSSSSSSSEVSSNEARFADRVGRFIHVTITCVFAAVGSFIGAVTGGLIGLATESGLLRGAGIGAISGAVFTIEAFETSLSVWHFNGSGIWSVLYVSDIVISLLSGRLIQEKVGPAMRSAVQGEMSDAGSPLMEAIDIFDTGATNGMAKELVDRIPKIDINFGNNADDVEERIRCTICLQDFELGETVRCLPHCQHKFHLPCIDGWLVGHGFCPLCRRDI